MRRDLVPAMNRPEPRELVVESRTLERLFTHAVGFGLLLPPVGRALLPSVQRLARGDVVLRALACSWLPTTWPHAAAVGAGCGFLEDRHCRLAWTEAFQERRLREPPLWTARTLVPSLAFFIHPFLALSALDGEMLGSNCAFAALERRPVRAWPFFAVLDVQRPSVATRDCRATYAHYAPSSFYPVELHLLWCRVAGGFYEVERRPENSRWRIL